MRTTRMRGLRLILHVPKKKIEDGLEEWADKSPQELENPRKLSQWEIEIIARFIVQLKIQRLAFEDTEIENLVDETLTRLSKIFTEIEERNQEIKRRVEELERDLEEQKNAVLTHLKNLIKPVSII